jgi:hypothetical protein
MARIVIGEGLWSTIRGYLNTMFTELYAAIGDGPLKLYTKNDNLTAQVTTRITTTLTDKPLSISIFDSEGNEITSTLSIKRVYDSENYAFDIWSSTEYNNVEINIAYK